MEAVDLCPLICRSGQAFMAVDFCCRHAQLHDDDQKHEEPRNTRVSKLEVVLFMELLTEASHGGVVASRARSDKGCTEQQENLRAGG